MAILLPTELLYVCVQKPVERCRLPGLILYADVVHAKAAAAHCPKLAEGSM
jgi:hypothetical protein